MEKFNVEFRKVSDLAMLGKTKRGDDGFGSIGVEVIKKFKESQTENEVITLPEEKVTGNTENNLKITSEKAEGDLQITSVKAVMEVNGEVVINESVTIED